MQNAIATTSAQYIATSDDIFAALEAEAATLTGGGSAGKAFLKFSGNDGTFTYGANNDDLEVGSKLLVNVESYQRGFICWVDGQVKGEVMTPLGQPAPIQANLPDYGPYGEDDGWSEQQTIELKLLDGEGTEMVFQANNISKRRAIAKLLKDFGASYKRNPGAAPVVEIGSTEFEVKGQGKRKIIKHAPTFTLSYLKSEDVNALLEDNPADYAAGDEEATTSRATPLSTRGRY
jgi:hypothetical protein